MTLISTRTYRVATIPGDGIGKEVIPACRRVLNALASESSFRFEFENFDWGADYYLQHGVMMPAPAEQGQQQSAGHRAGGVERHRVDAGADTSFIYFQF